MYFVKFLLLFLLTFNSLSQEEFGTGYKNPKKRCKVIDNTTVYFPEGINFPTGSISQNADGTVTYSGGGVSSATPTFANIIDSGLTASRLISSNGSKQLTSVSDLTSWVAGTANRVTVTSDGDGTLTLNTPQDLHTMTNFLVDTISASGAITGARRENFSSQDTVLVRPDTILKASFFDGGAGTEWIDSGGGTISDDTTNVKTSTASIKFTSTNNGGGFFELVDNFDLSTYGFMYFRCYIDDVDNLSQLSFSISTNGVYTSYYSFACGIVATPSSIYNLKSGWNDIAIPLYAFTSNGAPNWATVNRIAVVQNAYAGTTVNVTGDELSFYPNLLTRGCVILNFDDGYSNNITARQILDKYKYSACLFPITNAIGTAGFLTLTQIQDLQDYNKWDVCAHAAYQHVDWTTLSEADLNSECINIQKYLQQNKLKASDINGYPLGGYNSTVLSTLKKYFGLGRSFDGYSFGRYEVFPFMNPYNLRVCVVSKDDTLATIEGYIDLIAANKGLIILGFHKIETSPTEDISWSTSKFTDLIAYLATKSIDVLTFTQFIKKYYSTAE